MPLAVLDAQFNQLLEAAALALKPHGYRKRGNDFRRAQEGNVALIAFQRSGFNDSEQLKFTVNLSVISAALLAHREAGSDISRAKEYDGHLRERIGMLLPGGRDRWWAFSAGVDCAGVEAEVIDALVVRAVPFLAAHVRDEDLIALWKSGRAPGLTEMQRARFLAVLEGRS